jgi:C_GCAxxG_C_C family probable redox protein
MSEKSYQYTFARAKMDSGNNCCESIIHTADHLYGLSLPKEVIESGKLFGHGMGMGCTCGALVGLVLVSGILDAIKPHPLGKKLGNSIHKEFVGRFGSACCRDILKSRTVLERVKRDGCKDLTGNAADILAVFWDVDEIRKINSNLKTEG